MFTPAAFADTDRVWLDRLMQHDAFASAVATDAVGSPGWHTEKDSASRVPAWNDASAQLRGVAQSITGEDAFADLVDRLSQANEVLAGQDWRLDRSDLRQLRVPGDFRLQPSDIAITLKFSQNHPAANPQSVMAPIPVIASWPGGCNRGSAPMCTISPLTTRPAWRALSPPTRPGLPHERHP